jgi:hypothetical protein
MMEENIYNLIPPRIVTPKKSRRYKSTHRHDMPPTYSTLCNKNTSNVIHNMGGEISPVRVHSNLGKDKLFGSPKGHN